MVHFSSASLSLSARFPASSAGDVSSLFKSVSSSIPAIAGAQRGGGGGKQWVRNGATHLPPAEVFHLLVFMSVLQRTRWLLKESVISRVPVSVFRSISEVLG